MLISKTVVKH